VGGVGKGFRLTFYGKWEKIYSVRGPGGGFSFINRDQGRAFRSNKRKMGQTPKRYPYGDGGKRRTPSEEAGFGS